jgi:nucleoside-diphosphate-sugar epimerase
MVYGLNGAGNIERMVAAVARRRFVPWPRHTNRRSGVHVDDVIAALRLVSTEPRAAGKLYLVTDGDAYSTRWLYEQTCQALGRATPKWTTPIWVLRGVARLADLLQAVTGRAIGLNTTSLHKLLGDAWYSSERIRRELGFVAQRDIHDEITRLAQRYRSE